MFLSIKNDAIFIADAHYNKNRTQFDAFLNDIISEKIKTSQLFLMGDMFDFLCFEITYFREINEGIIKKINLISNKIEVIYIEGNHDFNLVKIFANVKVVNRNNQPLICQYKNEKVAVSHGDIFLSFEYNIFTKVLRNKFILRLLNLLDINYKISKYFEYKLEHKNICHEFKNFEEFASTRIKFYKEYQVDKIIEGHFHQGKEYNNYINVASYACEKNHFTIN
jgi:UDP-2,3-diacylglucosamine hydrolase